MAIKNKAHPELREGEVFIGNVVDTSLSIDGGWEKIGWRTKRIGNIAYDIYGKPIKGMRPVFAKKYEIRKKDPEILRSLE